MSERSIKSQSQLYDSFMASYSNKPSVKLLQDWVAYNESKIWDIASNYYAGKGIMAFSSGSNNAVPHGVNTNYQNALAFAKLINIYLVNNKVEGKIRVLECGTGSGLFAFNLLTALKDLDILSKVTLVISDYSEVGLNELDKLNVFKNFKKNEHYQYKVIDVLNPDIAKDEYEIIVLNYVLDALPLTVLKKSGTAFQELMIRLAERPGDSPDIMANSFYLSNLIKETQWQEYKIEEQSELEKKSFEVFSKHYETSNLEFIPYPYAAIEAARNLVEKVKKDGFVYISDISPGTGPWCQVVGNALAHEIDPSLLEAVFNKAGIPCTKQADDLVSRFILSKDSKTKELMRSGLHSLFVEDNQVKRYIDLREVLVRFNYKESADVMKMVLEEFDKIAKNSPYKGIFWGNYYSIIDDLEKAIEAYKSAEEFDYLDSYKIPDLVKRLELKLEQAG